MSNYNNSKSGDRFLFLSIAVLLVNLISQVAAFPLQCVLLTYAVIKSDIRLFPGMYLLMLDKSNFTYLEANAIKFNIGFAVSPQNVFLIVCFFLCLIGVFKRWYDSRTMPWLIPWMSCIVPAFAIALSARSDGLTSVWQVSLVDFLTPALYFWGIGVARTWDNGKEYFIKRMIILCTILDILSFLGMFYMFSFAPFVMTLALLVGAIILKVGIIYAILGTLGTFSSLLNVLFSRYLGAMDAHGYASLVDLGSSFTTVMVAIFGIVFSCYFWMNNANRDIIRRIPYFALVFCVSVFVYSVSRASTTVVDYALTNQESRTIFERFEHKLIGDRGQLWKASIEEALKEPLVFREPRLQLQMRYNPESCAFEYMPAVPPHNQVLTQLVRNGWWMGLFMVLFLWWTHVRAFIVAADMVWDKVSLCVLLAPSAAVFIPVGLTGQTVLNANFCGNALVTMVFPGIIYGVWQCRREMHWSLGG